MYFVDAAHVSLGYESLALWTSVMRSIKERMQLRGSGIESLHQME